MKTIAENLQLLENNKQAIKSSIESKGVIVGEEPMSKYSIKINNIYSGGVDEYLKANNIEYLTIPIINALTRSILLNDGIKNPQDIVSNNSSKALFLNNPAQDNINVGINYQGGILSIKNIDLSKATNLGNGFRFNPNLYEFYGKEIEDGIMDLSLTTTLSLAFGDCTSLQTISLYTPICENYSSTFSNCKSLKTVYLKTNGTPAVSDYIFAQDEKLETITFDGEFKTINSNSMFLNCIALKNIIGVVDLSSHSYSFSRILDGTPSLETVYLKGLNADGLAIRSPFLKKECLLYLFENAIPSPEGVTRRVYLANTLMNQLTQSEKEIIINKGYTLVL